MNACKAFVVMLLGVAYVEAVCTQLKKNCPENAPCCRMGWCSANPIFCLDNCEPENSFSPKSCYPQPGCRNIDDTFDNDDVMVDQQDDWDGNVNKVHWTSDFLPNNADIDDGNLQVLLKYNSPPDSDQAKMGAGYGARISSTRFLTYGSATAKIQHASCAKGVVSSFIMKNDEGDEIDFEWVGSAPQEVQSNYYWSGELDYTHGAHHQLGNNGCENFHEYTIDWTEDQITWSIDGNTVRTLAKTSTPTAGDGSYKYPSRPMRVQFSTWDGGRMVKDTSAWAGGVTDWSDTSKVFTMLVDEIQIQCSQEVDDTWPPDGYGPPKNASGDASGPGIVGPGGIPANASPTIPPTQDGAVTIPKPTVIGTMLVGAISAIVFGLRQL